MLVAEPRDCVSSSWPLTLLPISSTWKSLCFWFYSLMIFNHASASSSVCPLGVNSRLLTLAHFSSFHISLDVFICPVAYDGSQICISGSGLSPQLWVLLLSLPSLCSSVEMSHRHPKGNISRPKLIHCRFCFFSPIVSIFRVTIHPLLLK